MRYVGVAVTLLLAGCGDMQVELQSQQGAKGGVFLVTCARPSLEVGLHAPDRPVPQYVSDAPVSRLPIRSTVSVFGAVDGEKVYESTTETPVVYWMSEQKRGHIEYFGLQEVRLPFSIDCNDYRVELVVGELPPGLDDGKGTRFAPYLRRKGRP